MIDRATGELVERTTYQAYGNIETDYRPERWQGYRSDYKFTGKEEDIEVGLHYFGKRYYSAKLNRWISPDPITIHHAGADLNAYAYVHGKPFVSADPNGECEIVCAMIVGALVSMAIDAAIQAYRDDGDFNEEELLYAGLAGGAGGAMAAWLAPAAAAFFGSEFAGAVVGGMAGSVTSGITFRGQMSGHEAVKGNISFEESLNQTFNPQLVLVDVGLGAASGALTHGVNQLLKSGGSAARSTQAPSQANTAPRLSTEEIGEVGEAAAQAKMAREGVRTSSIQNEQGHGLDGVADPNPSNEIWVTESKATMGGKPGALKGRQPNMNEFVRMSLEDAVTGRGGYTAADMERARQLLNALDRGATLRGVVVETRYVGTGGQYTTTRPWTSATPEQGGFMSPLAQIDAPNVPPANNNGTAALSALGIDRAPILPITCYSRNDGGVRCDTTVASW